MEELLRLGTFLLRDLVADFGLTLSRLFRRCARSIFSLLSFAAAIRARRESNTGFPIHADLLLPLARGGTLCERLGHLRRFCRSLMALRVPSSLSSNRGSSAESHKAVRKVPPLFLPLVLSWFSGFGLTLSTDLLRLTEPRAGRLRRRLTLRLFRMCF